MDFIFLTDNCEQAANAVFNISCNLARELTSRGHSVVLVGNSSGPHAAPAPIISGARFIWICDKTYYTKKRIWEAYQADHDVLTLLKNLVCNPSVVIAGLGRILLGINPLFLRYSHRITTLCRKHSYQVVVAFSAPYFTAVALGKANVGAAKKLLFMMDPYSTHYSLRSKRTKRIEQRVLRRIDKAFLAKTIYEEYERNEFKQFRNKFVPVGFPCVAEREPEPYVLRSDTSSVHCVYAGSFYPGIRVPTPLYRLLSETEGITLTIVGRQPEGFDPDTMALQSTLVDSGKLILSGLVNSEAAYAAMLEADILVNVGNTVANMLPSKLFDYLSTGRPIVHIRLGEDALSSELLSQYPYALEITEDDPQGQAEAFVRFCRQNAGKRTPFRQIQRAFFEYTPQYAADLIEREASKRP